METVCLSNRTAQAESVEVVMEFLLLALLLKPDKTPIVVGAGASKSNFFFSRMYGASAQSKFGLKPKNASSF